MQTRLLNQPDHEAEFISCLLEAAQNRGICVDETAYVNLYVALKSKPLVILTGPERSGKISAVQCLVNILLGDCTRCQMMMGHPWPFATSENIAFFSEVHTRYTTEKLLCLIDEAWRPENANKVFITCLMHISPAELLSFFTEIAVQLRQGQLWSLGDVHFSNSIPFPSNLFLIGTIDTPNFIWWDSDLLSKTTVIQWPAAGIIPCPNQYGTVPAWEGEFLRSRVRQKQAVYHKVHAVLKQQSQPLMPLLQVEGLLRDQSLPNLNIILDETITYLANSWSRLGAGLFDSSIPRNLTIALDLAISQILLPGMSDALRQGKGLRQQLHNLLAGRFPRSAAFVHSFAE